MKKILFTFSVLFFILTTYSLFFSLSVLAQTVTLNPNNFGSATYKKMQTCGGYLNSSSFSAGGVIPVSELETKVYKADTAGANLKCLTISENDKNFNLSSDGFAWVATTGQAGNIDTAVSSSATANSAGVTICTDSLISNDKMEACLTIVNSPDCPRLSYFACIFDSAELSFSPVVAPVDTTGKEGQYGTESCDPTDQSCINCVGKGGIWIAIGCVDPTPVGVMTRLVQTGIGVMGGVALLQMIYAGIMYQTGNKEKIAKARSQISATLVGLAVLVFSILILEIIGVNILDVTSAGFF